MTPATQRARHASRIRWAEEELRTFDRNLRRAWAEMRSAIAFLNAGAGIDGKEAGAAVDRIDDTLKDSYSNHRKRLLRAIDDEGGRPDNFPWPLEVEKQETIT